MKKTDLSLFNTESLEIIVADFNEMIDFFENKEGDFTDHINDLKSDIKEIEKELKKRKNSQKF